MPTLRGVAALAVFLCSCLPATEPDPATTRWWNHLQMLAGDDKQGRDTGSEGYRQAETYVIEQFRKLGLKPGGTNEFRQPVPMMMTRLNTAASSMQIRRNGEKMPLAWLRQVTTTLRPEPPAHLAGDLFFAGDLATLAPEDARGKILVTLGRGRRQSGLVDYKGAAAVLTIDSLAGPEPPRWPAAYAVVYQLVETTAAAPAAIPVFRVNPEAADLLFSGAAHSLHELRQSVDGNQTVPNFALKGQLEANFVFERGAVTSDNIVAVLPGTDPVLKTEYVVLSAHLDGYGIGEPWKDKSGKQDAIYNGAFDDAAYVATLLDLAQTLVESHASLKRSLLFCIVTGEEKGLLGSRYFAAHPTVPKSQLAADLNLDQLRPIFPLKTLTVLALHDSTLGAQAEQVASSLGIRVQTDPEPERMLLMRSDHWSFMQIGVPALNFVFGYEKGTEDEATYRAWYAERYHSPADDLNQPWVPEAAAKFNRFYETLAQTVANAPSRPEWTADSRYRPTATAGR